MANQEHYDRFIGKRVTVGVSDGLDRSIEAITGEPGPKEEVRVVPLRQLTSEREAVAEKFRRLVAFAKSHGYDRDPGKGWTPMLDERQRLQLELDHVALRMEPVRIFGKEFKAEAAGNNRIRHGELKAAMRIIDTITSADEILKDESVALGRKHALQLKARGVLAATEEPLDPELVAVLGTPGEPLRRELWQDLAGRVEAFGEEHRLQSLEDLRTTPELYRSEQYQQLLHDVLRRTEGRMESQIPGADFLRAVGFVPSTFTHMKQLGLDNPPDSYFQGAPPSQWVSDFNAADPAAAREVAKYTHLPSRDLSAQQFRL